MTLPHDYFPGRDSGAFCRQHAFYSCPICRGEDVSWVIPIENAVTGQQTGTLILAESGAVTIMGEPSLPEPPQTVFMHIPAVSERERHPVREVPPTPGPSRSETAKPTLTVLTDRRRPTPQQIAAVAALFRDDSWQNEPRHVEAAAKGRAIHEKALKLSEDGSISYADAIKRVVEEGE